MRAVVGSATATCVTQPLLPRRTEGREGGEVVRKSPVVVVRWRRLAYLACLFCDLATLRGLGVRGSRLATLEFEASESLARLLAPQPGAALPPPAARRSPAVARFGERDLLPGRRCGKRRMPAASASGACRPPRRRLVDQNAGGRTRQRDCQATSKRRDGRGTGLSSDRKSVRLRPRCPRASRVPPSGTAVLAGVVGACAMPCGGLRVL